MEKKHLPVPKYVAQARLSDYGVWNTLKCEFVGTPIESLRDAMAICDWLNESELYIENGGQG